MKKNVAFGVGFFLLMVCLGVPAASGGVPGIEVIVSDGAGRLQARTKTDANGAFATRVVGAGNYVVQFRAPNAAKNRNDYAIFVAAGRHRVVADAVEGSKIGGAGVAMRLKVALGTPVLGQVAFGGVEGLGTKIVDGKRYVLIARQTGTNLGPQWVEEGAAPQHNVTRLAVDEPANIKAIGPTSAL